MSIIRVLLVEDHQIVREGIRRMLELEPDIKIVAEASNGPEALDQMRLHTPDIVLMDLKMPGTDGIQLTRQMTKTWPDVKIIILTIYTDYLKESIQAGARGYLSKDLRREELVQAIRAVQEGRSPLRVTMEPQDLAEVVLPSSSNELLSERERTVLKLISEGSVDKEIAQQLSLSETTVKRTVSQVFEKLGAKNRSEAVAEAMRRQIF